jgi:hypothetical protein
VIAAITTPANKRNFIIFKIKICQTKIKKRKTSTFKVEVFY